MSKNTRIDDLFYLADVRNSYNDQSVSVKIKHWGFWRVHEWNYINVSLPCWILHWNLTPGILLDVDGVKIEPGPENVLLFPPFTRFSGEMKNDFVQFYIHFTADDVFENVENKLIRIPSGYIRELVPLLGKYRSSLKRSIILSSIAMNSLLRIPDRYISRKKSTFMDNRIQDVLDMIRESPGTPHGIRELAESVHMSVNNFHRRFVACTSVTPKQYMLVRRLEFSRELLINTEKTIDEIAALSGFTNRYHFSKAFRSYYCAPPVRYKHESIRKNGKTSG